MTIAHDAVAVEPTHGSIRRGAMGLFTKFRPARFGLRTRIMSMFIIGALLCLIFSLFGAGIFPLMYGGGSIATPFRYILSFIPMFNFSKAVFDINSLSYTLGEIKGKGNLETSYK